MHKQILTETHTQCSNKSNDIEIKNKVWISHHYYLSNCSDTMTIKWERNKIRKEAKLLWFADENLEQSTGIFFRTVPRV